MNEQLESRNRGTILMEIDAERNEDRSIEGLPLSVQRIIRGVLDHKHEMSPVMAKQIVEESGVEMEDLISWADYDHPFADSYGRKLLYNGGFFEIMVMSWVPGDISGIHDHGFTQWGAVKVFGPAEHAAMIVSDNYLTTVARETFERGRVVPVGHELVHQLANMSQERFLTLHMYGSYDPDFNLASVTANARVYDITEGNIQRTDGGMFFALPEERINSREPAPIPDYASWLRNTTEYIRRLRKSQLQLDDSHVRGVEQRLTEQLFDADRWSQFESDLFRYVDQNGHMTQMNYWNILRMELIHAANLQREIEGSGKGGDDSFGTYADLYDEVIGKPCLDSFIAAYFGFVRKQYGLDFASSRILSIGCGTGLMERHVMQTFGIPRENLLGIDISEAMVRVASKRIQAVKMDVMDMDPSNGGYDITYAGLNVFQYMHQPWMERAIQRAAQLTRKGGYFFGDFVTPDHVRWYPHVIRSENVISLRQPTLLEKNHNTYQQSEIINVSRLDGRFRITYEGKHVRYLPSMWKLRYIFKKVFGGKVDLYDAVTLEPLKLRDDTCPSTRYLVVAHRA